MKLAIFADASQRERVENDLRQAGHGFDWIATEDAPDIDRANGAYDLALHIAPFPQTDSLELTALRRRLPQGLPLVVTDPDHLIQVLVQLGPGETVAASRRSSECRVLKAIAVQSEILHCPPYSLDLTKSRAWIGDFEPELTPREFDLAAYIFARPNQTLDRELLLNAIWGYGDNVVTRTLDTHMSRLRRKLQLTGRHGWSLRSIYQRGYRLECPGPDGCPSLP
ncbi:response regulator transcription factor [Ectothiorhodospiraceae bacterium WFHF3C12]|nr:response regulator transcription factor [Ectothiorhodospiraceae bacterium WFHF3C12]